MTSVRKIASSAGFKRKLGSLSSKIEQISANARKKINTIAANTNRELRTATLDFLHAAKSGLNSQNTFYEDASRDLEAAEKKIQDQGFKPFEVTYDTALRPDNSVFTDYEKIHILTNLDNQNLPIDQDGEMPDIWHHDGGYLNFSASSYETNYQKRLDEAIKYQGNIEKFLISLASKYMRVKMPDDFFQKTTVTKIKEALDDLADQIHKKFVKLKETESFKSFVPRDFFRTVAAVFGAKLNKKDDSSYCFTFNKEQQNYNLMHPGNPTPAAIPGIKTIDMSSSYNKLDSLSSN